MATRKQGTALATALCLFIGTVVVIQLWLVAGSLDAWLSGEEEVLVPAALTSAALLLLNTGLLAYELTFDARLRRGGTHE
jgi:hypothetical protein